MFGSETDDPLQRVPRKTSHGSTCSWGSWSKPFQDFTQRFVADFEPLTRFDPPLICPSQSLSRATTLVRSVNRAERLPTARTLVPTTTVILVTPTVTIIRTTLTRLLRNLPPQLLRTTTNRTRTTATRPLPPRLRTTLIRLLHKLNTKRPLSIRPITLLSLLPSLPLLSQLPSLPRRCQHRAWPCLCLSELTEVQQQVE